MSISASTQLPSSFAELTFSLARSSVCVDIPSLYEPKNIPWVLPRMPSCAEEVVIVAGRSQDNALGVERALRGNVVVEIKQPSRALTRLTDAVLHNNYSELCCGYRALRRECLDVLQLESEAFKMETELIVRAARAGLRRWIGRKEASTVRCRADAL